MKGSVPKELEAILRDPKAKKELGATLYSGSEQRIIVDSHGRKFTISKVFGSSAKAGKAA